MAEREYRHLRCVLDRGVLVATLLDPRLQDEQTVDALSQELLAALLYHRTKRMVIDFRQIIYISSVAFRPLLNVRRTLHGGGGRLVLCGLSKVVGDVFYTTKMLTSGGEFAAPFEMADDTSAALELLGVDPPSKKP